jgi:hypothetical protein
LDEITEDRFFAQCLARLESMQTMHEDEALSIAPHQDWSRLPDLKHALSNLLHSLRSKRRTALYRDIDACYRELFAPHATKALLETIEKRMHMTVDHHLKNLKRLREILRGRRRELVAGMVDAKKEPDKVRSTSGTPTGLRCGGVGAR